MPAKQISRVFPTYDLFGKAFPGLVFLLGLLSLVPVHGTVGGGTLLESSATTIALAIILLTILGFAVGQALHSAAVKVETYACRLARYGYLFLFAGKAFIYDIGKERLWSEKDTVTEFDKSVRERQPRITIISVVLALAGGAVLWYLGRLRLLGLVLLVVGFIVVMPSNKARSYGGLVFIPHRAIFRRSIRRDWTSLLSNSLISRYQSEAKEYFESDGGDMQLDLTEKDDLNTLYILTMSELQMENRGRAAQHQSILSFCRTSWMVLLLFGGVYYLFWLDFSNPASTPFQAYSPALFAFGLGPDSLLLFAVACFFGVAVLIEGVRQSKVHFLEYLMADFLTLTRESRNNAHPKENLQNWLTDRIFERI